MVKLFTLNPTTEEKIITNVAYNRKV